jgi:hypothetical protein
LDQAFQAHETLPNQPLSYGVIYQIRGNRILIVAVVHLRKKPVYWRDRLK